MSWDSLPRSEDRRVRYATTYMDMGGSRVLAIIEYVPGAADRYPVRVVHVEDGESYGTDGFDEALALCEQWNDEQEMLDDADDGDDAEEVRE